MVNLDRLVALQETQGDPEGGPADPELRAKLSLCGKTPQPTSLADRAVDHYSRLRRKARASQ